MQDQSARRSQKEPEGGHTALALGLEQPLETDDRHGGHEGELERALRDEADAQLEL